MPRLVINNQKISVPQDTTILTAANQLGFDIPTLCFSEEYERTTSCMVCVVHETKTDQLLPACSAPVVDGMEIETDNEKVRQARKDALDLLLSEHVGDCEAPCQRACPAHMNIPLMIRQIKEKKFDQAIITVKKHIALPAVLGRICPAPCEKVCNRKYYDSTVSICLLKRFAADVDLDGTSSFLPHKKPDTGKRVAIVGTGPTGLSCAYYLLQNGHSCCVFDRQPQPGGMLRYGIPEGQLPRNVLNAEISIIQVLGAELKLESTLGSDFTLDDLKKDFNAVVLAVGKVDESIFKADDIRLSRRGIEANNTTFETNLKGVFAGGNAIGESHSAVRAAAHGRSIAVSVDQYVRNREVTGTPKRFNSIMGRLHKDEEAEFLKDTSPTSQTNPKQDVMQGFSESEAITESTRCFHCDCRKPNSCKLRLYAEEYKADQRRFRIGERKYFQRIVQHDLVIYESGKCIKCGLCIQVTERARERLGLTFVGRGFDVRVEIPFNEPLSAGLEKVASECVEICPTAALALRNGKEESDDEKT